MQEYSRKAALVESRLEVLHERSMHHDDHLRLIDLWWRQLLDEVALLVDSTIPEPPEHVGESALPLSPMISTGPTSPSPVAWHR
jgi:hypothetical protein